MEEVGIDEVRDGCPGRLPDARGPDQLEMVGRQVLQKGELLEELRGFIGAMSQNGPGRDPAELSRSLHDEGDPWVLDMENIDRFCPEVRQQTERKGGLLDAVAITNPKAPRPTSWQPV